MVYYFLVQGFFDGQLSYMVESQLLNFSRAHIFSRKLFLGGLPPDIDEGNKFDCKLQKTLSLNLRIV